MKNFLNYLKLKIPKLPEKKIQTGDIFADEEIVASAKTSSNYGEYRGFWIIGIIVVAIGLFLYNISDWVLLVFTGIIISIALESMITYIEKKTRKRWLGILLSYLFLIWLLISGILVMIPFLINQIGDAVSVVVKHAKDFESLLKTSSLQEMITGLWGYSYLQTLGIDLTEPKYLQQIQSVLQNNISAIISFSTSYAKGAGNLVVDTVGTFLNTLVQIWFVLTLSVLLSIERNAFVRFLYRITGNSPIAHKKIALLYKKLGFWLKTQLLLGLYIGIAMYTILWILALFGIDIPSKGSLAVISALTELIPYIWPTLGGVPVVIMAGISNGGLGVILGIAVVFCVQWLENNVLIPLLFKQNLGVSPVLIFLCMVLWGITVGINGVILAIPIAVIITILFGKGDE